MQLAPDPKALPLIPSGAKGRKQYFTKLLGVIETKRSIIPQRHGIRFDTSGERAPLEQLPCPMALQLAAQYYVLSTLDTSVSLRKLIDSGFWPYDTFPTWLDLSETL